MLVIEITIAGFEKLNLRTGSCGTLTNIGSRTSGVSPTLCCMSFSASVRTYVGTLEEGFSCSKLCSANPLT